jgi:hypothetical protein
MPSAAIFATRNSLGVSDSGCLFGRYPGLVSDPSLSIIPTVKKPALSEAQRVERLRLPARRLRSPEGLDREILKNIERLTGDEQ